MSLVVVVAKRCIICISKEKHRQLNLLIIFKMNFLLLNLAKCLEVKNYEKIEVYIKKTAFYDSNCIYRLVSGVHTP